VVAKVIGVKNVLNIQIILLVVDSAVAAEVVADVEARCATHQVVMEIVGDQGATAVILIPHPLLHLICVSAWTATEVTEVVVAAVVMEATIPEAVILMLATSPWEVAEAPLCLTDAVDPLATLHPDLLVDAEIWVDLVQCADLIRTQQGTRMEE